jgi:hypothetical protein
LDRGFDAGDFLADVAGTGAQFLVRLNASRKPPVLRCLPDGSFTSVIGGVQVRIIAAQVTVTCHDGTVYGGWYRLATSLLDHRAFPASRLMALYQALRIAITDAIQAAAPGTDPDRASYQAAVDTAQDLVITARTITDPDGDLAGSIGRAVLSRLNPAPPAPSLRPPRQVPPQPLEQAPTRQAHHQQENHPDHQPAHPRRPRTRDTPPENRGKPRRTLEPADH